ncbi:CinA family protein [Vibrio sagamiensis]
MMEVNSKSIGQISALLGEALGKKGLSMTTAESCTGGGVASAITDIAGSSAWFDRAFITYSNQAKMEMLDVNSVVLESHGAVSEPVVKAMVEGALRHSDAHIGAAISGIAGPGGGSVDKPVGTVCFAFADREGWLKTETLHFDGDRRQVRQLAIQHVLVRLLEHLR